MVLLRLDYEEDVLRSSFEEDEDRMATSEDDDDDESVQDDNTSANETYYSEEGSPPHVNDDDVSHRSQSPSDGSAYSGSQDFQDSYHSSQGSRSRSRHSHNDDDRSYDSQRSQSQNSGEESRSYYSPRSGASRSQQSEEGSYSSRSRSSQNMDYGEDVSYRSGSERSGRSYSSRSRTDHGSEDDQSRGQSLEGSYSSRRRDDEEEVSYRSGHHSGSERSGHSYSSRSRTDRGAEYDRSYQSGASRSQNSGSERSGRSYSSRSRTDRGAEDDRSYQSGASGASRSYYSEEGSRRSGGSIRRSSRRSSYESRGSANEDANRSLSERSEGSYSSRSSRSTSRRSRSGHSRSSRGSQSRGSQRRGSGSSRSYGSGSHYSSHPSHSARSGSSVEDKEDEHEILAFHESVGGSLIDQPVPESDDEDDDDDDDDGQIPGEQNAQQDQLFRPEIGENSQEQWPADPVSGDGDDVFGGFQDAFPVAAPADGMDVNFEDHLFGDNQSGESGKEAAKEWKKSDVDEEVFGGDDAGDTQRHKDRFGEEADYSTDRNEVKDTFKAFHRSLDKVDSEELGGMSREFNMSPSKAPSEAPSSTRSELSSMERSRPQDGASASTKSDNPETGQHETDDEPKFVSEKSTESSQNIFEDSAFDDQAGFGEAVPVPISFKNIKADDFGDDFGDAFGDDLFGNASSPDSKVFESDPEGSTRSDDVTSEGGDDDTFFGQLEESKPADFCFPTEDKAGSFAAGDHIFKEEAANENAHAFTPSLNDNENEPFSQSKASRSIASNKSSLHASSGMEELSTASKSVASQSASTRLSTTSRSSGSSKPSHHASSHSDDIFSSTESASPRHSKAGQSPGSARSSQLEMFATREDLSGGAYTAATAQGHNSDAISMTSKLSRASTRSSRSSGSSGERHVSPTKKNPSISEYLPPSLAKAEMRSTDSRSEDPSIDVSDVFGLSTDGSVPAHGRSSTSFGEQSRGSKSSHAKSVSSRRGASHPFVINEDEVLPDSLDDVSFGIFSTKDATPHTESFSSSQASLKHASIRSRSSSNAGSKHAIDIFNSDGFGKQPHSESFSSQASSRQSSVKSRASCSATGRKEAIDMFQGGDFGTESFAGSQALSEASNGRDSARPSMQDFFAPTEDAAPGKLFKEARATFESSIGKDGFPESSFTENFFAASPKQAAQNVSGWSPDKADDAVFGEESFKSPRSQSISEAGSQPRQSDIFGGDFFGSSGSGQESGVADDPSGSRLSESFGTSKDYSDQIPRKEESPRRAEIIADDHESASSDGAEGGFGQSATHFHEKSITLGDVFGESKVADFGRPAQEPDKPSSGTSGHSTSRSRTDSGTGDYSSRRSGSYDSSHRQSESFQSERNSGESYERSHNSRSGSYVSSHPSRSVRSTESRSYTSRSRSYGSSHPSGSSRSAEEESKRSESQGSGSRSRQTSSRSQLSRSSRSSSRSSAKFSQGEAGSRKADPIEPTGESFEYPYSDEESKSPAPSYQSSHPSQSSRSSGLGERSGGFGSRSESSASLLERSPNRESFSDASNSRSRPRSRSSGYGSSRSPSRERSRQSSFGQDTDRSQSTFNASFSSDERSGVQPIGSPKSATPQVAQQVFGVDDDLQGRETPSSFEASFSSRSYESVSARRSPRTQPAVDTPLRPPSSVTSERTSSQQSTGESSRSLPKDVSAHPPERLDEMSTRGEEDKSAAVASLADTSKNVAPIEESKPVPEPSSTPRESPGQVIPDVDTLATGESPSLSILRQFAVPLVNKKENVYVSVRNKGYLFCVEAAYMILLEIRPRIRYMFSMAEWCHVHILMLYSRVFDCELKAAGIDPPEDFRIHLPDEIQVLEPLALALSSIGIVDDASLGVRYVPVAKPLYRKVHGDDPEPPYEVPDPEDVTEFLEWTQYDWNSSWIKVEQAREARKVMAAADGIQLPEKAFPSNDSKLLQWEQLALEKWLGYDDNLWFSYDQTVRMLRRKFCFVDFPTKSPKGSYAWLIPRLVIHSESTSITSTETITIESVVCKIPKPTLSAEVWMIALLFDFCALPVARTITWYYQTKPVNNLEAVASAFLRSAVKSNKKK